MSYSFDIDNICQNLSKTQLEYDERNELIESTNIKIIDEAVLFATDDRYSRYLRGVSIWEVNGKSYEYIRDNIKLYLSIKIDASTFSYKLQLMRNIDSELKKMIDSLEN